MHPPHPLQAEVQWGASADPPPALPTPGSEELTVEVGAFRLPLVLSHVCHGQQLCAQGVWRTCTFQLFGHSSLLTTVHGGREKHRDWHLREQRTYHQAHSLTRYFSKLKITLTCDLLHNAGFPRSSGKNLYVNCHKESPKYKQLLFEVKINFWGISITRGLQQPCPDTGTQQCTWWHLYVAPYHSGSQILLSSKTNMNTKHSICKADTDIGWNHLPNT